MSLLRPQFHIAGFLKFTLVFSLFLALFHVSGVDRVLDQNWPGSVLFPLGQAFICTCVILFRGVKRPRCQSCGRSYLPIAYVRTGGLCPTCCLRKRPPEQRHRGLKGALLVTLGLFLTLAFVLLWPFSAFLDVRFGWLAYPALAVGLFVLLFVLYAGWMVLRVLTGNWRMSRPGHALKLAQTCAGEAGRREPLGSISVYVFGRIDPVPMLAVQVETCRRRFESLVGRSVHAERPLRVFAFGRRLAFEGFCRRALLDPGNVDGLFMPWSARTIMLTSEFPAYRLGDPERVARILLAYYYLDAFRKGPTPLWLQTGIAYQIACGGDDEELAQLNRKLMPALTRSTALGTADLFNANPLKFVRLLRSWQQLDSFSKYDQLVAQSSSVVEYLCGRDATNDQCARFRGFLTELKPTTPQEAVFERHFGYGLDVLLERWRAWVLNRGVGTHRPPPGPIRHALLGRIIPIVADAKANPLDRVQAIREMGKTGYVLGADSLIDLLGADDGNLSAEAAWALEAISGLPLGQDPDRWVVEWLSGLPAEVIGMVENAG